MSEKPVMLEAEMKFADSLVQEIPKDTVLPRLIAHRGFHYSTKIKNWEVRPTENGLPAYDAAYKLGLRLAECDITYTKDGILLLSHDRNFMRVSKNKRILVEGLNISDHNYSFWKSQVVLQDGSTPPTLLEVLNLCKTYCSRLVVELKHPAYGLSERVLDFFILNPDMLEFVESFISPWPDSICMLSRAMRRALREVPRLPKFLYLAKFGQNLAKHRRYYTIAEMDKLHEIIKNGELDGLVIKHDIVGGHPTLKTVAFTKEFKEFLERYDVGIYGLSASGNDHLEYIKRLISHGFSYVNTSLPVNFLLSQVAD